jgi:hypothetical protein
MAVMKDDWAQYVFVIRWRSRDLVDRFSAAVIEVRDVRPDAFGASSSA